MLAPGLDALEEERDEPTSWNTPLVVDNKGRAQVVVNGMNRAAATTWRPARCCGSVAAKTLNAIPSPVAFDGLAICMSGYRGAACRAIPLDATGDITDTTRLARCHDRGTPYVPSPLLVGVYFISPRGTMPC